MAVKIRMTRMGRRHRPFFRINAIDSREPRDGKILEKLGHYDPLEKNAEKQVVLKIDRIEHWLSKGAIPSDSVSDILNRVGIKHKYAEQKVAKMAKAKAIIRKKGIPFNEAERVAITKAAEAEALAKEEAKKAAEAKAAEQAKAKEEAEKAAEAKAAEEAKAKEEAEKAAEAKAAEEAKPEEASTDDAPADDAKTD